MNTPSPDAPGLLAALDEFAPSLAPDYPRYARWLRAKEAIRAALAASGDAPKGSICKCGLAKSYHGPNPPILADHDYEPRYSASGDAPREGLVNIRLLHDLFAGHDWGTIDSRCPFRPACEWESDEAIVNQMEATEYASGDAPTEDPDCDECRGKPDHWHHQARVAPSPDAPELAGWLGQIIDEAEADGHRVTMNVAAAKRLRAALAASESHPTKERTDG